MLILVHGMFNMEQIGFLFAILGVVVVFFHRDFANKDTKSPSVRETLKSEYDYIIVGAGTAGSVLAARLAEDTNNDVLLLEAGGHFHERPEFRPAFGWSMLQTEYDWEYYTESQKDIFKGLIDQKGYWPRGKVVGGSGNLNGLQYTRGSPFDFDEWAGKGCSGWSYRDVLPYFLKSEDIQIDELKSSPYHKQGGPISVTHSQPTKLTPLFLQAGKELGYDVRDYNGLRQEGFSIVQSTVNNGERSSTALAFFDNEERKNLDIGIRSFVTKIEIENGKATGVYYIRNGRKTFVKARKEIILSAGAIASPQLLMLSGIGPTSHLGDLGIPLKKDLPVGEHLKDHQLIMFPNKINVSYGLTESRIFSSWSSFQYKYFRSGPLASTGLDGSAFLHIDDSKNGTSPPDIQIIFLPFLMTINMYKSFKAYIADEMLERDVSQPGFTADVCLTRPKSIGTLKLRSTDPFDHPVINPGYFSNEEDIKTMIGGIRIWEKLAQTNTFKEIGVDINRAKVSFCSEHEFRSDAYWECYIRHIAVTEYHHASTCKMGPDNDPSAVLDLKLRVRGIQNLRVVDASAFPDITSGNINAPIVMLAEKAADLIRGTDTVADIRKHLPN